MNKKNNKIINALRDDYSISIKDFFVSYCGINDSNLLNSKISHEEVSKLLPNLVRVSFDHVAKNLNLVYVGDIILVNDSYNNLAPYKKPLINEYEDINIVVTESKENKDEICIINFESLTDYELIVLTKKLKSLNRMSDYRNACLHLRKRKEESKINEYKMKKEKILIKIREDDEDEY